MDEQKKRYITLGLAVLGIAVVYFFASYVVPRIFVSMTKAAPATKVSIKDSYILAGEKILAKADGKDRCFINVFVMDQSGKGVLGKRVTLEGAEGIIPIKDVTDNEGKTSFAITSAVEGQFTMTALVEGIPLTRGIKITFRN